MTWSAWCSMISNNNCISYIVSKCICQLSHLHCRSSSNIPNSWSNLEYVARINCTLMYPFLIDGKLYRSLNQLIISLRNFLLLLDFQQLRNTQRVNKTDGSTHQIPLPEVRCHIGGRGLVSFTETKRDI